LGDRLGEGEPGRLSVALAEQGHAQCCRHAGVVGRVVEAAGGLCRLAGRRQITRQQLCLRQPAAGIALLLDDADLVRDADSLAIMLDRLLPVVAVDVAVAQVAQESRFALSVADVAGDGQGLLREVDGPSGLP
jgi:hypothetical protein